MGTTAVEIRDVTKRFRRYREKSHSLKERVIRAGRNPHDEFWALRDVSFEVDEGETVGLLGHNGSGKSTLLKCVAGTLRPTSGTIRTRGRMAALLELGAGFHPDLTGRENVYLNGSVLGFSSAQIDRIFDDIVAFAEIGDFIDNQVKHYSSGMYARLGFAVAVNVDPDVLLVDEVLAVGDEAFQRKCLERVKQFQKDGRTILMVTHAADLVRQICDRAVVLDHGELVTVSNPSEAVRVFRETLLKRGIAVPEEALDKPGERRTLGVQITAVRIVYPESEGRPYLRPGEPMQITVAYRASHATDDVIFALGVHDQDGNQLLGTNTQLLGCHTEEVSGSGEVTFDFERVPLNSGIYPVSIGIHNQDGGIEYDHRDQLDHFEVSNPHYSEGRVVFPMTATLRQCD